jgi:hypothetical protein
MPLTGINTAGGLAHSRPDPLLGSWGWLLWSRDHDTPKPVDVQAMALMTEQAATAARSVTEPDAEEPTED